MSGKRRSTRTARRSTTGSTTELLKPSYSQKCRSGAIGHVISMWITVIGVILLIVAGVRTVEYTELDANGNLIVRKTEDYDSTKLMIIFGGLMAAIGGFALIGSTVYLLYKKCYRVVIFFLIANMIGIPI